MERQKREKDMLEELRMEVYRANMELPARGLVTYTWGNVSGIDRKRGLLVIKPSGLNYEDLTPEKLVVLDLKGRQVEGELRPSSDTATHLQLYRAWPQIGGIVHTHSSMAASWAQARRDIPLYGTTHADYFYGPVPCTRDLTPQEIEAAYEEETGNVILETFDEREVDRIEAIVCSMTPAERRDLSILNGSRRSRIAKGSGTTVQAVNELVDRFGQAKKMMEAMASGGGGAAGEGGMPGMGSLPSMGKRSKARQAPKGKRRKGGKKGRSGNPAKAARQAKEAQAKAAGGSSEASAPAAPAAGSAFGLGGGAPAGGSGGYGIMPDQESAASGSGDEVADAMNALPEDLKRRLGL